MNELTNLEQQYAKLQQQIELAKQQEREDALDSVRSIIKQHDFKVDEVLRYCFRIFSITPHYKNIINNKKTFKNKNDILFTIENGETFTLNQLNNYDRSNIDFMFKVCRTDIRYFFMCPPQFRNDIEFVFKLIENRQESIRYITKHTNLLNNIVSDNLNELYFELKSKYEKMQLEKIFIK